MPLYAIHHVFDIDSKQRATIAKAITALHCKTFGAPSIFVNVTFQPAPPTFIAGREVQANSILAQLRPRPSKPPGLLDTLTLQLLSIWDGVFNTSGFGIPGSIQNPRALHTVFVMETIHAGAEQGFLLPTAGNEDGWVQQNIDEFKKRAEIGDGGMKGFVNELCDGLGNVKGWEEVLERRRSEDTLVHGE